MKKIIAITAGLFFLLLLMVTFAGSVSTYQTFGDGVEGHVVGTWAGEIDYDPGRNMLTFTMTDEADQTATVVYNGPRPDNFFEAEQLVIRGHQDGEIFFADHILVKCPSKYNADLAAHN